MTNTIPVWTTVDDEKVETFPIPGWRPYDEAMVGRVRTWAENLDDVWLPTSENPVDETLRHWREVGVRNTSFDATTAASPELKRFTGDVLRYRKGLLAATLPDGLVHHQRYRVPEHVSMGWAVQGREVYVVGRGSVPADVLVALTGEPWSGWNASGYTDGPARRFGERFGTDADALQWVHGRDLVPIIGSEPEQTVEPVVPDEGVQLRAELAMEKRAHRADVEALLEAGKDEAVSRGYCPDYDAFVRRTVRDLSIHVDPDEFLPERRGYAEWDESYTVTLRRRRAATTVWSDEKADSIANETDAVDGWIRRTLRDADLDDVTDVSVAYEEVSDVGYEVND